MVSIVLADHVGSISELKANPTALVEKGEGMPVAILSHNTPVFYCIPANAYEALMEYVEDLELAQIVRDRENEPALEVCLNDL